MHFELRVHGRWHAGAHHVIQQGQGRASGGGAADSGNANGVVLCAGEQCCGGCRVTVGAGQDGFVGVHDGLHRTRGVGLRAGDKRAVQCAVDGGNIACVHSNHPRCGISCCGQTAGSGIVGLGCGADGVEGCSNYGVRYCRIHHGLQLSLGVHTGSVVGGSSNGRLHGGQVGIGDAGDAHRQQINQVRRCATGRTTDDATCRIDPGRHFQCGVHVDGGAAVQHVVQ